MRKDLLKFKDEKLATMRDAKLSRQVKYTKETRSNLTTSGSIGLGLLTMFLFVLSQSMRIELDNRKDIE